MPERARIAGIDDRLGSLTVSKVGDVALWSGDPLDVMSGVERASIDGRQVYRYDPETAAGTFTP